jgi:hypothetical protein
MKPISELKIFRSASTAPEMIKAVLRLFANPKRHIRGPTFGDTPGNGRASQGTGYPDHLCAVSACAMGALDLVCTEHGDQRVYASEVLGEAADAIYPGAGGYIGVADGRGLKAFRRVAKRALADLRANA